MKSPFNRTPIRFLNKVDNSTEIENYDGWWEEQINMYGTAVDYYRTKVQDNLPTDLYGEDTTSGFHESKELILTLNLNENAIVMEKFGLVADDEVTAFIHIKNFYKIFGEGYEPAAGDVFDLSEFGSDRPGGRGGKHFEITEKIDQDVQQINPLLGHYVWLIKAKRHDYSFETNLDPEKESTQVEDIVTQKSLEIFNYTEHDSDDDVYGGYIK